MPTIPLKVADSPLAEVVTRRRPDTPDCKLTVILTPLENIDETARTTTITLRADLGADLRDEDMIILSTGDEYRARYNRKSVLTQTAIYLLYVN